jgi:hypothetical protein
MNKLPRITEIIKIEPFKITVRWTTGEIRVIDFAVLFAQWAIVTTDLEGPLLNYETFQYAWVGPEKTLQWPTVLVTHTAFDGNRPVQDSSPLAFDPDVLYAASQPIDAFRLVLLSSENLLSKVA